MENVSEVYKQTITRSEIFNQNKHVYYCNGYETLPVPKKLKHGRLYLQNQRSL